MNKFTQWYSGHNIYIKLLPFLILYIAICILFTNNELVGDEGRYLSFANNLLNGFYSPPYPNIDLWNGPGYPVFLMPFVFCKFPLIALRLLNGFLLYFSLIISYKTLIIHSSTKSSILFTILLGLYFPIFELLPLILTESLSWFLISLLCFIFMKNYKYKVISWKFIFLTSIIISYLAMTKVIFGYVILTMFCISIISFLIPQLRQTAKKPLLIFSASILFCLPWLIYTFSLTNKVFYWSNSGSMSLYTMSTPYVNELGDWKNNSELLLNPNHNILIDSINKLKPIEQEIAFKKAAIKNIKNHPKKYISNWTANIGRLLFSYPYSNAEQTIKTYFTIIPNMFVIVFIVLSFSLSIVHYKKIPEGLIILFLFFLIYLLGSTLVSAFRRMFYITIPFWLFFISCILNKILSIKINHK